jgi:hypothetical protein
MVGGPLLAACAKAPVEGPRAQRRGTPGVGCRSRGPASARGFAFFWVRLAREKARKEVLLPGSERECFWPLDEGFLVFENDFQFQLKLYTLF